MQDYLSYSNKTFGTTKIQNKSSQITKEDVTDFMRTFSFYADSIEDLATAPQASCRQTSTRLLQLIDDFANGQGVSVENCPAPLCEALLSLLQTEKGFLIELMFVLCACHIASTDLLNKDGCETKQRKILFDRYLSSGTDFSLNNLKFGIDFKKNFLELQNVVTNLQDNATPTRMKEWVVALHTTLQRKMQDIKEKTLELDKESSRDDCFAYQMNQQLSNLELDFNKPNDVAAFVKCVFDALWKWGKPCADVKGKVTSNGTPGMGEHI